MAANIPPSWPCPIIKLAHKVANVARLHLARLHARVVQSPLHGLLQQLKKAFSLAGCIGGEVGLVAPQDVNGVLAHGGTPCQRSVDGRAAARAASRSGALTSLPLRLRGSGSARMVMKSGVL